MAVPTDGRQPLILAWDAWSIDPVQDLIITNHGFHLQTSKVGLVIIALINLCLTWSKAAGEKNMLKRTETSLQSPCAACRCPHIKQLVGPYCTKEKIDQTFKSINGKLLGINAWTARSMQIVSKSGSHKVFGHKLFWINNNGCRRPHWCNLLLPCSI